MKQNTLMYRVANVMYCSIAIRLIQSLINAPERELREPQELREPEKLRGIRETRGTRGTKEPREPQESREL